MTFKVETGLDRLATDCFALLKGQRVGLLLHPASVDHSLRPVRELMLATDSVDLRALFGPQHGLLGQTQDNMIEWEGYTDPDSGLPVFSLYGKHRKPTSEMLAHFDTLVIDLQDVGARYYTFIWTMLLSMEACAEAGKRVVVLDRPNPIGGLAVEGTVLEPGFESFVGLAPIPMRHGLTIGELAGFFARYRGLDLDLEIVLLQGWRRAMDFAATDLPWVLPSPNMPTLDTAFVYPGGCLLEGTELSEGRGTTRPFEIMGAPYIVPQVLMSELEGTHLPGVQFRPLQFEPTFHKFAGEVCGGLQVHVSDRDSFLPVATYTAIIGAVSRLWPDHFSWKQPPYEYEKEKLPIDILAGGEMWRRTIDTAESIDDSLQEMRAGWKVPLAAFAESVAEFRRYE
ncbi:MAG: DUF1343 domain-containing protein [Gemmatimonadales bacterium]|nr:DUF1343 domain-containing protein [Gemmatimonadales bacterium]